MKKKKKDRVKEGVKEREKDGEIEKDDQFSYPEERTTSLFLHLRSFLLHFFCFSLLIFGSVPELPDYVLRNSPQDHDLSAFYRKSAPLNARFALAIKCWRNGAMILSGKTAFSYSS